MRQVVLLVVTLIACGADVHAQRRGRGGLGTFAIFVTDPSGAPIPDVLVTIDGPARRSARTEGGRIAFERLPLGSYRLHFERDGFIVLDREVAARTGQPIDVKVTLKPVPPPPSPVPPLPPRPPAADAKPVVLDLPTIIEKEYVGRAASRSRSLACAAGGSATLIQLNRPLAEHSHADADEILYVIAGTGTAQMQDRSYPLQAGVFAFVPRGMPHSLSATGRGPLTVLSTKAGEPCGAPPR